MKTSKYAGKTAIITGGASGIGAAIGRELARRGADVVLADRQADLAESVAAKVRSEGGRATAKEVDVRSFPSMTRLVSQTVERTGTIDYFFNNAGIAVGGEMDCYTQRDWDDVIDVNLRGVAYGIQAVYPVMVRQRSGHIVNTASTAGLIAAGAAGSYTATKFAVVGLSRVLRIEAKRHGVRVSALCPGAIRTPILTGGKFGRMGLVGISDEKILQMWAKLRPMDADAFARAALEQVEKERAIIVVPRWWRLLVMLERLAPDLSSALWERVLERTRADLEAAGARPAAGSPEERILSSAARTQN
jgi:NAD(P)-dependent dehydrogenase (short-subunit alcohol dehydrogenase family)